MTDFGVEWRDGEMLMRCTGDIHIVHLGRDDEEGYITRWSRSGGVNSIHYQGPRAAVLAEWGRLRGVCFSPRRRELEAVRFPGGD